MNFIKEIWKITRNIVLIAKSKQVNLFFIYAKLKIRYLIFEKILRQKITGQKIFGWDIRFFDYAAFIYTFEEIFISQEYYFETENHSPLIIDAGSNFGMAVFYFKKKWPDCQIIAFEPDKKAFLMLKNNIENNHLANIKLYNVALAKKSGTLKFYNEETQPGSLISSTIERYSGQNYKIVEATTLSEKIMGTIDFMKMDIEGAEIEVLEELDKTGKIKLIKDLCLEYHHHIEVAKDNLSQILINLEKNNFGYQISTVAQPPLKKRKFQDILIRAYSK